MCCDDRHKRSANTEQADLPGLSRGTGVANGIQWACRFLASFEGVLAFGGVFFLFYFVRAMGAGDVKLAAALGSLVGPAASFRVMFATAIAGGAIAIVIMVLKGRVKETLRNTFSVAGFHAQHGLKTHPSVNLDNAAAIRMPYGVAFAAGTLYWSLSSVLGEVVLDNDDLVSLCLLPW